MRACSIRSAALRAIRGLIAVVALHGGHSWAAVQAYTHFEARHTHSIAMTPDGLREPFKFATLTGFEPVTLRFFVPSRNPQYTVNKPLTEQPSSLRNSVKVTNRHGNARNLSRFVTGKFL